jgi:glycogen debranching enzyme
MWNEKDKKFYTLDAKSEPIKEVTVSNLFPLLLDGLKPSQLEAVLDLMDKSFNVPFPLPSVATDSPNYDPHNREADRLWRGPTWMITNWLVTRGLQKQLTREDLKELPGLLKRCGMWNERIVTSSRELIDRNGAWEHYDPVNGNGQRPRVKNFAWSYLAYFMQGKRTEGVKRLPKKLAA